MKTEKNILIAFLLNAAFSVLEFIGGILTGSVAILSDAVHDLGDATSIGVSYYLERKSKRAPDERYTYGYARYSVIGSFLTVMILLLGSCAVISHALRRMVTPEPIHYDGMIVLSVIGIAVNLCATLVTRKGSSLNQKAVNLHMLEDVLGWVAVLIGAIVMRWTGWSMLDPLLSIGVAVFILIHAVASLQSIKEIFLEKTPREVDLRELREHLTAIDGVLDVHHIHVRSIDGQNHCATMHVIAEGDFSQVKKKIRQELKAHGIGHVTLELEVEGEPCGDDCCRIFCGESVGHARHHHHHHHHHHRHE